MNQNKTQPTNNSVLEYIASVQDPKRQSDAYKLNELIEKVTGIRGVIWGSSIVGFGSYHYKYATGREGDSPKIGFSARKQALVVYGLVFYDQTSANNTLLEQLGPHTTGKGCLYIKSLEAVNSSILERMIKNSFES